MINESKVREMHGVHEPKSAEGVRAEECESTIQITVAHRVSFMSTDISPSNARRLANRLHRLAGRIERRLAAQEVVP